MVEWGYHLVPPSSKGESVKRFLLAILAILLISAPVAAAKPNSTPLHLTYQFGGPTHNCDSQLGIYDDLYIRTWEGIMQPGETFSQTLYFCPLGGGSLVGVYASTEGYSHYSMSLTCTDISGNPCEETFSVWPRGKYQEAWSGCEINPAGWATITVQNDGSRPAETRIGFGADFEYNMMLQDVNPGCY